MILKCLDCKQTTEAHRAYFEEVSWKRKGEQRLPYKRTGRLLCHGCLVRRQGTGQQGKLA